MSSGKINVNYAETRSVVTKLRTEAGIYGKQLARVKAIATWVTANGFVTDKASIDFEATLVQFVTNSGKAVAALNGFADFLSEAADAHGEADTKIAEKLGGGGTTSHLEIDLPEIQALQANLKSTLSSFKAGRNASSCLSEAAYGHHSVASAMDNFDNDWKIHRGKIVSSLDALSQALETIDDAFTELDSDLTSTLKG